MAQCNIALARTTLCSCSVNRQTVLALLTHRVVAVPPAYHQQAEHRHNPRHVMLTRTHVRTTMLSGGKAGCQFAGMHVRWLNRAKQLQLPLEGCVPLLPLPSANTPRSANTPDVVDPAGCTADASVAVEADP